MRRGEEERGRVRVRRRGGERVRRRREEAEG